MSLPSGCPLLLVRFSRRGVSVNCLGQLEDLMRDVEQSLVLPVLFSHGLPLLVGEDLALLVGPVLAQQENQMMWM